MQEFTLVFNFLHLLSLKVAFSNNLLSLSWVRPSTNCTKMNVQWNTTLFTSQATNAVDMHTLYLQYPPTMHGSHLRLSSSLFVHLVAPLFQLSLQWLDTMLQLFVVFQQLLLPFALIARPQQINKKCKYILQHTVLTNTYLQARYYCITIKG